MFRVEVLLCMSQTPRHRGRPQRLKARSVFTSNIVFFTVRVSVRIPVHVQLLMSRKPLCTYMELMVASSYL